MSKLRWAMVFLGLFAGDLRAYVASASQTIPTPGSPYIVDTWGIEDGLPGSSVLSVIQTHDGYLWLGTLYGLVRFDGLNFTRFDEANTPGLNSSRIVRLFEDGQSNLWVGTESAGVTLIKNNGQTQSFDLGAGSRDGRLISICEDSNKIVWLLTGNRFLGRYQNDRLTEAPAQCKMLLAEPSGQFWMGTDNGLFAIQGTAGSSAFILQQMIPVNGHLDYLLASHKGGYWRLADGRIQKWTGSKLEHDFGAYPWGNRAVTSACEDQEGNIIVGTYGDGIYWLNSDGRFTHLLSELSHPSVLSVTMDREGNLWIGTNGGGLDRVKRKVFGVLAGSEGRVVQSVCAGGPNTLWIGYNGNLVDRWQDGKLETFSLVGGEQDLRVAQNSYVKSVFVDRSGQIWAGMWSVSGSRLYKFDGKQFQPTAGADAISQEISVLFQDKSGTHWIGTLGGLVQMNEHGYKVFTAMDGLPGNEIRALAEGAQGNLWIATGQGLARLKDGQFSSFRKKDGLPSDDLSCLFLDQAGDLWIGTRGSGLARLHAGKWTHYTTKDGLAGNSIGYIIEDGKTNLWIGSNAGLTRVPVKSLDDFAVGTTNSLSCRVYVGADGLPTRECTQGSQPAACRTEDGKLWFPTTKGLVYVDPTSLKANQFAPPVMIESVLVEGQEQFSNTLRPKAIQTVVIPPGKEYLEIHFTSLNLGSANQSRFKYRLAGQPGWNEVGDLRDVSYPKLPPGNYVFEVKACNEDGAWNPVASTLTIIVEPPFWRKPWFLGLAALVLLVLVIAIVHYVSTQKLVRQLALLKQQEELERERARIARDLHDQLGANLMQVALLGELAESDRNQPDEVKEHARQITQTARETTKGLDEIVWAVNPSNDTLDSLITYICKYAQEYFELAGLRYRLEVPAEVPKAVLPPEVRHNIFLAAKEAVNNVVKHAEATEARLRLKLNAESFALEIEDNGRGCAVANQKTGRNGLRNMRKRLEDAGGSFSMNPAPERGTLVTLTAPLTKQ